MGPLLSFLIMLLVSTVIVLKSSSAKKEIFIKSTIAIVIISILIMMMMMMTTTILRAIVIHAGVDDLGQGGASDSLTTGNAGARLDCCIIELKESNSGTTMTKTINSMTLAFLFVIVLI